MRLELSPGLLANHLVIRIGIPASPIIFGQSEYYLQQYYFSSGDGRNGNWNNFGDGTIPFVCEFESQAPAVKLTQGALQITGTNVQLNSSSQLTADFNLSGATPGLWNVVVTDLATNNSVTLTNGFQINQTQTSIVAGNLSPLVYHSNTQSISVSATVSTQFGSVSDGNCYVSNKRWHNQ